MQYPRAPGAAFSSSGECNNDALQVLASTASNDQQLRERYHRDGDQSSNSSPVGNGGEKPCSIKSNSDVNSEDDESESRSSGSSGSGSAGFSKRTGLRKGKWTAEEEEYATRFIHYFSSGLLTLPEGKTLRASLAEKLHCDPMRITKKYAGASCLGSKISKLSERPTFSPQDIEMARLEIARLDRRFHTRLAQGVGVPLPPDDGGPEMSNTETQHLSSTEASSYHLPGDTAQNCVHSNASNNEASSFIHQVSAPDAVHPHTTSLTNATAMSHETTIPPAALSYLATVAGNANFAAATVAPNIAPILVTAPVSAPPTHAVVQQQINPHLDNNPKLTVQQAATASAVNWPMMFQGMNQIGVNNASLTTSNEQLVQTLLLQITMQLQALATLSPSTLKQIQLQILVASMTAATAPAPAVSSTPPQQAQMPWAEADAAAILAQFQLAAAARQVHPVHPAGTLPAVNAAGLQHILPLAQATVAPLLNQYGKNALGGVSTNSVPLTSSTSIPAPSTTQVQGRDRKSSTVGEFNIASQVGTLPNSPRPRQAATTGNNMTDFLDKLKQRHAEALEQEAKREQAEQGRRVGMQTVCPGGETKSMSAKASVSLTNSSSGIVEAGAVTKKQKQKDTRIGSGIVALLPFEHATTVSSGSGCTTIDGSTSSSTENLQASDETRNDGSTSSNTTSSYSEEDEDDIEPDQQSVMHCSSVPLRKRFRSENNGGITRRNLENHNFRMAAEDMKNQDK